MKKAEELRKELELYKSMFAEIVKQNGRLFDENKALRNEIEEFKNLSSRALERNYYLISAIDKMAAGLINESDMRELKTMMEIFMRALQDDIGGRIPKIMVAGEPN